MPNQFVTGFALVVWDLGLNWHFHVTDQEVGAPRVVVFESRADAVAQLTAMVATRMSGGFVVGLCDYFGEGYPSEYTVTVEQIIQRERE